MDDETETGRTGRVPAAKALLLPCLGPVAFLWLVQQLAPRIASGDPELSAVLLRNGGWIGVATGFLAAFLVALWVVRSTAPSARPTAFLGPMALGLLLKLALLVAGTLLLHGPLKELGHHAAFALAFVISAFSYQLGFQQLHNQAVRRHRMLSKRES